MYDNPTNNDRLKSNTNYLITYQINHLPVPTVSHQNIYFETQPTEQEVIDQLLLVKPHLKKKKELICILGCVAYKH